MSMKKLAASGEIKKVDKFRVPLGMIATRADNIRNATSKENAEHIDAIYAALEHQFQTDLEVCIDPGPRQGSMQLKKGVQLCVHDFVIAVDENDNISTVDGNMSWHALKKAVKNGLIDDRFLVDAVTTSLSSREQVLVKMIQCGQSKNPSPLEFGRAFKELNEGADGAEPWPVAKIAERFTRTPVSVRELIRLAAADPRIHAMIEDGTIASHHALAVIKEYGDEAYEMLRMEHEEAGSRGKSRVTAAAVHGRALPKKIVHGVIQSVETFASRIDNATRRRLAELENLGTERLKGQKVEVDADILIELLRAGGQIEDEKNKQAARTRDEQNAAAQVQLAA